MWPFNLTQRLGRYLRLITVIAGVTTILVFTAHAIAERRSHEEELQALSRCHISADYKPTEKDLALESSPFIREHFSKTYPSDPVFDVSDSGAVGVNSEYEQGRRATCSIALQRDGGSFIIQGIINNQADLVEKGLKVFEWAKKQQGTDGSFPCTGDVRRRVGPAFHNTSFVVQATSRSMLLLKNSPFKDRYIEQIAMFTDMTRRAAEWMAFGTSWNGSPANVWSDGVLYDSRYSHRFFVIATGFGLTDRLTGKDVLMAKAREMVEEGLAKQVKRGRDKGCHPEKGGCDTGYQSTTLRYAAYWVVYFPHEAQTRRVCAMIDRGLEWLVNKIDPATGFIKFKGNTRTCASESNLEGEQKKPHYPVAANVLTYWGVLRQNSGLQQLAQKVRAFELSGRDPCAPSSSSKARTSPRGGNNLPLRSEPTVNLCLKTDE